jgi:hypothetical protein
MGYKIRGMKNKPGTGKKGMEGVRVDIFLGRAEYFICDLAHGFVYFKHDAA